MSGHFTDRDERNWQRRAEEQAATPLDIGSWIRSLRSRRRSRHHERRPVGCTTVSGGTAYGPPSTQISG